MSDIRSEAELNKAADKLARMLRDAFEEGYQYCNGWNKEAAAYETAREMCLKRIAMRELGREI